MGDVDAGASFKESLNSRGREGINNLKRKANDKMAGRGLKAPPRRKRAIQSVRKLAKRKTSAKKKPKKIVKKSPQKKKKRKTLSKKKKPSVDDSYSYF
jgi:hypothetical protein